MLGQRPRIGQFIRRFEVTDELFHRENPWVRHRQVLAAENLPVASIEKTGTKHDRVGPSPESRVLTRGSDFGCPAIVSEAKRRDVQGFRWSLRF